MDSKKKLLPREPFELGTCHPLTEFERELYCHYERQQKLLLRKEYLEWIIDYLEELNDDRFLAIKNAFIERAEDTHRELVDLDEKLYTLYHPLFEIVQSDIEKKKITRYSKD